MNEDGDILLSSIPPAKILELEKELNLTPT